MSFFGTRRQVDPAPHPTADAPPRLDPPQPPADISQPVGFETVLGANSVMEGSLSSAANVRLDGTFTGVLEIGGNVLIGETAKITADVNARNISIAGAVRGNVAGKKVQLLRTGRVWGDIHAQALTTEEGAFIDGKITMVGHEYSPSPARDLEPEPELHLPDVIDEPEAEAAPDAAEAEAAALVSGEAGEPDAETDGAEVLPAAPDASPERPADELDHLAGP